MFHHQKSSNRSSDQNLQINLLQPKQRESRVNIVRANMHKKQNDVLLNNVNHVQSTSGTGNLVHKPARGSAIVPKNNQLQAQMDLYDSYSAFNNVDISEPILLNPSMNNPIVGVILFLLLLTFTPLQTLLLCGFQQLLDLNQPLSMILYLATCQLLAYAVLYYFKWVEHVGMLGRYLGHPSRPGDGRGGAISWVLGRPWLVSLGIVGLVGVWEVSYACLIMEHDDIQHLIVFYIILLPQISCSLHSQQQLHNNKTIKYAFYLIMSYLYIYAFLVNQFLLYGGIAGVILIYLSIRVGRVTVLVEYLGKLAMLIGCGAYLLFAGGIQDGDGGENWVQEVQTKQELESTGVHVVIIGVVVISTSMILVRCINNKILRVELYKYFYSDTYINNALLLIPFILKFIENYAIDFWVGILGCGVLFTISYFVGRAKEEIVFQLQRNSHADFVNK